jgi:CspA family cold shock protein
VKTALATGRILQFDVGRGYGFVAADDGGEDVFLHASVFDGDSKRLVPGLRIEFQTMAGDRGRKAYAAHLIEDEPAPPGEPFPSVNGSARTSAALGPHEEDGMCDVLPEAEFEHEITQLLLEATPDLTGSQILRVRRSVMEFGKKRGWIDD